MFNTINTNLENAKIKICVLLFAGLPDRNSSRSVPSSPPSTRPRHTARRNRQVWERRWNRRVLQMGVSIIIALNYQSSALSSTHILRPEKLVNHDTIYLYKLLFSMLIRIKTMHTVLASLHSDYDIPKTTKKLTRNTEVFYIIRKERRLRPERPKFINKCQ